MQEQSKEQSEFNSAISFLNRINALFFTADESAMGLDIYTWFHSLCALRRELSTEMNDDEYKYLEQLRNDLSQKVNRYINDKNSGRKVILSPDLYDGLDAFEMRLRNVMKTSGMLLKMKDDASKSLR